MSANNNSSVLNIYSVSLGCPKNRVDTEHLFGGLASMASPNPTFGVKASMVHSVLPFSSLSFVDTPEKADCVFVNTCGFIAPAIEESIENILDIAHSFSSASTAQAKTSNNQTAKKASSAKINKNDQGIQVMQHEEAKVKTPPLFVVGGCLVGRYGADILAADLPEVDLWLDTKDLENWTELLARALLQRAQGVDLKPFVENLELPTEDKLAELQKMNVEQLPPVDSTARLLSTGPSYAWLKISEGCSQRCSFCTIPGIRGPLRSTTADDLAREASKLLGAGVKELVLVAQDLTSWGRDLGIKHGLATLLEKLLPLSGLKRLRLMYLYPAGLDDYLLSFLAGLGKHGAGSPFVPYFDVPLQHAHPDILKKMGRPFSQSPFDVVERVRKYLPEAALRTSLITGFPGENTEQFKELKRFVRESRFAHLGVFAYQAEEGTEAGAMEDQIAKRTKERRRASIMRMQAEISQNWLSGFLGQDLEILLDTPDPEWPGLFRGRAWFQAPEIDGITYVSGEDLNPGDLLTVRIGGTHTYDLEALA